MKLKIMALSVMLLMGFSSFAAVAETSPGGFDLKTETMEKYLTNGLQAFEKGDFLSAEDWFQRLVLISPDQIMGNVLLGRARFQLGKMDKAIEAFNVALKKKPDDPRALTYLGEIYEVTGQYEDALLTYRKIKIDELPEAEREIMQHRRDSLENRISAAFARYDKAKELVELEKHEEALRMLIQSEALIPTIPGISATIGEVYFKMGRFVEAIIRFRAALVQEGATENTLLRLAMSFDQIGMPVEALAHLNRWRELTGETVGLRDEQKRIAGLAQKEESTFEKMAFKEKLAKIHGMYSQGLYEEAINWANKIDDKDLDDESLLRLNYLKAIVDLKSYQPENSLMLTEKAAEIAGNPKKYPEMDMRLISDIMEIRGLAFGTMDRDAEATGAFETAIKLYPENTSAAFALVDHDEKQGKSENAKKRLDAIIANDPQNSEALYRLGLKYLDSGNKDQIINIFTRFIAAEPDSRRSELARELIKQFENPEENDAPAVKTPEGGFTFTGKEE